MLISIVLVRCLTRLYGARVVCGPFFAFCKKKEIPILTSHLINAIFLLFKISKYFVEIMSIDYTAVKISTYLQTD